MAEGRGLFYAALAMLGAKEGAEGGSSGLQRPPDPRKLRSICLVAWGFASA